MCSSLCFWSLFSVGVAPESALLVVNQCCWNFLEFSMMVKYNRLVCCFRKDVWGINMLYQSHQKQQEYVAVLTFLANWELSMIQFVLKS